MAEYKKPRSEEEFEENFEQIKPLMNETQAYYESSRCLFCFDAPCIQACPTGIDIPLFIKQINSGNKIGAAETIYQANYFGNSCGKVCPTEVLCEGACVYNHQEVKPIEIGRLQSFATTAAIDKNIQFFKTGKANGRKIAVIGCGPAGISCACELRMFGYEVDIYESKSEPSGLTIHGVAPYKITNQVVLDEMNYLQNQFGFDVFYNHPIDDVEKIKGIESIYDSVFLGIGLGETKDISIPGEDLKNCHGAVEFIENLRRDHHLVSMGDKVIVIGGGNTAMDAASESARLGAKKVILAYRGFKEQMSAYEFEYDLAKSVGVEGVFNITPLEIIGDKKVERVKFAKTENKDGELTIIEGSEYTEECDMVIRATGQSKQVNFLSRIENLEVDNLGRIKVNPENHQTTNPFYFAAGDAVNGGVEVVNAVAEAKVAANGIHQFLSNHEK